MLEKNVSHMRPVIVKQLLHYDILFALESQGLLDRLTFQGGTCLRLYFVGGYDFSSQYMNAIKGFFKAQRLEGLDQNPVFRLALLLGSSAD